MPLVLANAPKTAVLETLRLLAEDGTMELLSGGGQVLAIFTLSNDAGAVVAQTWTPEFVATTEQGEAAAGAGTVAASARFKDAGAAVIYTGVTVSLTGGTGDLKLDNTSITTGQNVVITSLVVTL